MTLGNVLPALPYAHAALEPHVDARTMALHHGQHHASYVDNLNAALADYPELQQRPVLWLLLNSVEIPVAVRTQRDGGKLQVSTTHGHDNPLTQGQFPVLVNDVWEHAYYLKHGNRRLDYLNAWWAIADWDGAARRYEMSGISAAPQWQSELGQPLARA